MNLHAPAGRVTAAPNIIRTLKELEQLDRSSLRLREEPNACVMCTPNYFDVDWRINEFMDLTVKVNRVKAICQWGNLFDLVNKFRPTGWVEAKPGLLDMVFAANAALIVKEKDGTQHCIASNMIHKERWGEMSQYRRHLRKLGCSPVVLSRRRFFEGQGDALLHPNSMLLWGGYGHRSTPGAYRQISALLNVPVITLRLVSKFYHLDTCFCPLDEKSVIYYPAAFSQEGVMMIEHVFERKLRVTPEQAETFACNSIVIGEDIIMPKGDPTLSAILGEWGFTVHYVDMSEFLKSGGAARCLVLDHYL